MSLLEQIVPTTLFVLMIYLEPREARRRKFRILIWSSRRILNSGEQFTVISVSPKYKGSVQQIYILLLSQRSWMNPNLCSTTSETQPRSFSPTMSLFHLFLHHLSFFFDPFLISLTCRTISCSEDVVDGTENFSDFKPSNFIMLQSCTKHLQLQRHLPNIVLQNVGILYFHVSDFSTYSTLSTTSAHLHCNPLPISYILNKVLTVSFY